MTMPAFAIFEGGGAKGLCHIAGLRAAEDAELELIGVAGASAGALIAALVAVGYRAKELFDPDSPKNNLLDRHGFTPLSMIGEADWAAFQNVQRRWKATTTGGLPNKCLRGLLAIRSVFAAARRTKAAGGYFDTVHVREAMNNFLRIKIRQHHAALGNSDEVPARIRFRDIDYERLDACCPLKIVVTDISNQRMVVFDNSEAFADVEVAEVVAASIAIPGLFKPARIPSHRAGGDALYVDGGLVSNMPLWVFSEEKLNYERQVMPNGKVPILAFSLTDKEAGPGRQPAQSAPITPGSIAHLQGVARTAIFGGQSLARQFTSDVHIINLPTSLGLTDFDLTNKSALDAYYDASVAAVRVLKLEMQLKPARIGALLQEYHKLALRLLDGVAVDTRSVVLRVLVLQPYGRMSFRVTHALNADAHADDRLAFSRWMAGAPEAFGRREPTTIDFGALLSLGATPGLTKYEFALLPRHLKTALCFPIFKNVVDWAKADSATRDVPLGVVMIDSDTDLSPLWKNQTALHRLATESVTFAHVLDPQEVQ